MSIRSVAFCWLLATASAGGAFSQTREVEVFATSGMPRRPANFAEQSIQEMIKYHQSGDIADAVRIQRKLARYYADKGDGVRARAALQRAMEAENAGEREEAPVPRQPTARPPAGMVLTGSYYGYDGRTLHTWDFQRDGSFLHTWMVSGAGTSVRNSERGRGAVTGDVFEMVIESAAGGFVTPGVGGRTTAVGGGSERAASSRRVHIKVNAGENTIVLDGVTLKRKSW